MIYLSIGSNLGNRRLNIEQAKFRIIENNIKILQSSNYYESLSWPNKKNPKFLNIVLKISTNLKPSKLLKIFQNIEKSLGRKNAPRNSPRICDIDIVDFAANIAINNSICSDLDRSFSVCDHYVCLNISFAFIPCGLSFSFVCIWLDDNFTGSTDYYGCHDRPDNWTAVAIHVVDGFTGFITGVGFTTGYPEGSLKTCCQLFKGHS